MQPTSAAQSQIVETLRKALKARKLTYKQVADRLEVSEQTIKRLFAGDDVPMSRLEAICEMIEMSIFDLVALARDEEKEETFELTVEQETFLAENPHHLRFFAELRKPMTVSAIRAEHGLSARAAQKYLKDLEAIELLERHPKEVVKLKVRGAHNWRKGGPLQLKYSLESASEFLRYLSRTQEKDPQKGWTMSETEMSVETLKELVKEMHEVAHKFRLLSQRERKLYGDGDLISVKWLFAMAGPYASPSEGKIPEI